MSERTVKSQAGLDKALRENVEVVYIDSPACVWLTLSNNVSSHVEASGSSHVVARGSSHVEASGSSHVVARESSHVVARESSHVVARESSHVEARGSSHVVAAKYTAVHLHSQRVTLDAQGAVIDLTQIDFNDPEQWADYHGVATDDGKAVLYKAVDDNLAAGHCYTKTTYAIGETVTAADWQPTRSCGHGLHLGATPSHARYYFDVATRFLACEVDVASMVPLDDKVKVPSCRVLYEVDIHGKRLDAKAVA